MKRENKHVKGLNTDLVYKDCYPTYHHLYANPKP